MGYGNISSIHQYQPEPRVNARIVIIIAVIGVLLSITVALVIIKISNADISHKRADYNSESSKIQTEIDTLKKQ